MNRLDITPTPVTAEITPIPDSSRRGYAVDLQTHTETHRKRGLLGKILMGAGVVAVTSVGPDIADDLNSHRQAETRAAVARIEAETPPKALQFAQTTAAQKLFGVKEEGIETDLARKIANQAGTVEALNVSSYVSPERVRIGEDGKFFTVDGKDYELARRQTEAGDVYILAGRHFVEDGILKDRNRLISVILVGGAHNDASSDLNKDGVTTPEEVRQSADLSARHNLNRAFQPPRRIEAGKIARNDTL